MKERPILFSAEMVRAILEQRKSQTRRVVKASNSTVDGHNRISWVWGELNFKEAEARSKSTLMVALVGPAAPTDVHLRVPRHDWQSTHRVRCDFEVGDRLWVREAWYYDIPPHKLPSKKPADFDPDSLYFRADGECCAQIPECQCAEVGKPKWKSSIHLPRWASRITLEVTGVRVQRLQEISTADALAEGMLPTWYGESSPGVKCDSECNQFENLWERINGEGSWEANPWVWVVEFKRVWNVEK